MRTRILAFCALLAVTATFGAQQTPPPTTDKPADACPVVITNINPRGNESTMHNVLSGNAHETDGHTFVLRVKNTSGKDIKGMKFQAGYYDATEDLTDIPVSWEWTDALKTNAEKSFHWENSWTQESGVGWKVTLTKVLFDDGSKWYPATGQSCSGEHWRKKQHKGV